MQMEIDSLPWLLDLSCQFKVMGLDRDISISFTVRKDIKYQLEIRPYFSLVSFLIYKHLLNKSQGFRKLIGIAQSQISSGCSRHYYGKAIFTVMDEKSSLFPEPGIWCPASRTLEKLPNNLATVPAYLFHEIGAYTSDVDLSIIEKRIRPLVSSLNSLEGINTLYSCHGHKPYWFCSPRFIVRMPFVRFLADKAFHVLHIADSISVLSLNYPWILRGFVFNDCPVGGPYILWELTTTKHLFSSRKISSDIETLAYCLENIKRPQTHEKEQSAALPTSA